MFIAFQLITQVESQPLLITKLVCMYQNAEYENMVIWSTYFYKNVCTFQCGDDNESCTSFGSNSAAGINALELFLL